MSAYETLAASYDRLTYDVPYEEVLQFLQKLCARFGVKPQTVLDLACGTGSLSVLLAQAGYQVLGVDRSAEMLTLADRKAAALPEGVQRPYFILQSMQKLRLPQPVDAVFCCLDSLNYLTKPDDCQRTLRRVFDALRPGGVLIFDVNTPFKLENLDGQVFLDENEDTYCVWRAEYNPRSRLCSYGMDLFQREGPLWRRSFEEHVEYAYRQEELVSFLRQAGFTQIRVYADRKLRAPKPDALRIYFAAKKKESL